MTKEIAASLLATMLTAAPVLARSGAGRAAHAATSARVANPSRAAKGLSPSRKSGLRPLGSAEAQLKLGTRKSVVTPAAGASARVGEPPPLSAPSVHLGAAPNLEKSTGTAH